MRILGFFTEKESICASDNMFSLKSPCSFLNDSSGESSRSITTVPENWGFSHWNHLLVLIFGQLIGCGSLRELTDITTVHAKRSYNLGFGASAVVRNTLSKANMLRDPGIFEEYAFYMVSIAQQRRITNEFELHGRFYAVDSTTIDLCMSVFRWAHFRSTKSDIRENGHPDFDIV